MGTETMNCMHREGDLVRCIDNKGRSDFGIEVDEVYVVRKIVGHSLVALEGIKGAHSDWRFDRVSTVPPHKADDKSADMVTTPNHYSRHPIEPIRFVTENYGPGFLVGNVIKYITRYDAKNGAEDLKKAARYLEMLTKFEAKDPDWYK